MAVSNAISARGPARRRLPGGDGPDREARPMTTRRAGSPRLAPPRRVVVTGMGLLSALGTGRGLDLGRARRRDGPGSGRSSRSTRPGSTSRIAAEVHGFRRERRPRPEGHPADRSLHPVRPRGGPPGARPGRPARAARGRARRADRGDPRLGAGRRRHAVRQRPRDGRARTGPDQPVLHPDGHRQHRCRPGGDRVRADRAELRDRVGLRDRGPRDRRVLGDDPARATPT